MDDIEIRYVWDEWHAEQHPVVIKKDTSLSCDDNDVDLKETICEVNSDVSDT